jgi:hypothetical protein
MGRYTCFSGNSRVTGHLGKFLLNDTEKEKG